LKFIVDLIQQAGLSGMLDRISETAKWGAVSAGPKIIDPAVKGRMKEVLAKIQGGQFARQWQRETSTGRKHYERLLRAARAEPIEEVGARLRAMMPWLGEKS
jgi:ketol-acid reductoisomerase